MPFPLHIIHKECAQNSMDVHVAGRSNCQTNISSPDCILNVSVVEFYSRPLNRDISLFAVLRVALSSTAGALLYSTEVVASYDFWLETDAMIRGKRRLDGIVATIVSDVRDHLSRFLETRAAPRDGGSRDLAFHIMCNISRISTQIDIEQPI